MLTPAQIIERLEEIERDLADRQPKLETAAEEWTRRNREKEQKWAEAYMQADGQVTDRKAAAIHASEHIGIEEEARYKSLKGVVAVLETRASIGQSLLRSHGRVESASPSGQTYGMRAS